MPRFVHGAVGEARRTETGAGEGIRTLDPNLGKVRVEGFYKQYQLFVRRLKNQNTIRISQSSKSGRIFSKV
jgi:hypothetical protein